MLNISEQLKEKVIYYFTKTRLNVFQIAKVVAPNGEISLDDVLNILETYQKKNGKKIVREGFIVDNSCFKRKNEISDDIIEDLVNNGYSEIKIANYFKEKGFKISYQAIHRRKEKIFAEKGLPVPSVRNEKRRKKLQELQEAENRKKIRDEEINKKIFHLREDLQMSLIDIVRELGKDGIYMGTENVKNRCIMMYKKANKDFYVLTRSSKLKQRANEEKIFNLVNYGCTYNEIAEFYDVSHAYIMGIYNSFCEKRELEKAKKQEKIPTEKIIELRKLGLTYMEIIEFFKSENKSTSLKIISIKLKKYYERTGEKIERGNINNDIKKIDLKYIDKETLKNIMYYLRNTRNATDEQIYKLFKCYGIEMDDVIEAEVVDEKDLGDR